MAYTQADVDALKAAIKEQAISGISSYTVAGLSLAMLSPQERMDLLRLMEADVATTSGRSRFHYGNVRPGG